MSLSWRDRWADRLPRLSSDRVLVGFAPERLSALNVTGHMGLQLVNRHELPIDHPVASGWDKGIEALSMLLAEPGWHGHDITVILSSHYVRHAIVPAVGKLNDAESQSLAKVVFGEIFGDLARDWDVRVSPAREGTSALACGVPRALITALQAACAAHGQLRSLRPGLMPVLNRVRREIGSSAACIALIEPGRVTLASVDNQQWQYVDSRAGSSTILPQLLLEEGELHARQPGGILWLCDLTETSYPVADSFWSYRRIAPPRVAGFDDQLPRTSGMAQSLAIWGAA